MRRALDHGCCVQIPWLDCPHCHTHSLCKPPAVQLCLSSHSASRIVHSGFKLQRIKPHLQSPIPDHLGASGTQNRSSYKSISPWLHSERPCLTYKCFSREMVYHPQLQFQSRLLLKCQTIDKCKMSPAGLMRPGMFSGPFLPMYPVSGSLISHSHPRYVPPLSAEFRTDCQ